MFPSRMIKLFSVVLARDADRVTRGLLRQGVMQFVTMSEMENELSSRLHQVNEQHTLTRITEIRKRIEGFLHPLGFIPSIPHDTDVNTQQEMIDTAAVTKKLDDIAERRQAIRERQRLVQQERAKLEDIKRHIDLYGTDLSTIALKQEQSFIAMRIGTVPAAQKQKLDERLRDYPSVHMPVGAENDHIHYIIIFMRRDREKIEQMLHALGWVPADIPRTLPDMKDTLFQDLSEKIDALAAKQKQLQEDAEQIVQSNSDELNQLWVKSRVNELFFSIQSYFKKSSRLIVFSGWVPVSKKASLSRVIEEATDGKCFYEWLEPEKQHDEKDAPVQLRNPGFLKPFQMLVANFGVPEYGSIDPTPFIMPIYLGMFGLMFSDVGHGILICIFGIVGVHLFKRKSEVWQNLSALLVWCGASSTLFGLLLGSYFGMSWFKPLWFDFHGVVLGHTNHVSAIKDISDILAITVYFGIAVIVLGLLFNWINLINRKRWQELVFDKGGILGGWLYGGGIFCGWYMVQGGYRTLPDKTTLLLLIGIPALLLFMKAPIHYIQHRDQNTSRFSIFMLLHFGMEWIVELLEIFSGYLSNTLSFMRVAGLGIAHVSLMIAFFSLAQMTQGVYSLIILIAGNILVICLEGLSAGIQALRLNYYEFFTKFFHGTGKLYTPISLKSKL